MKRSDRRRRNEPLVLRPQFVDHDTEEMLVRRRGVIQPEPVPVRGQSGEVMPISSTIVIFARNLDEAAHIGPSDRVGAAPRRSAGEPG